MSKGPGVIIQQDTQSSRWMEDFSHHLLNLNPLSLTFFRVLMALQDLCRWSKSGKVISCTTSLEKQVPHGTSSGSSTGSLLCEKTGRRQWQWSLQRAVNRHIIQAPEPSQSWRMLLRLGSFRRLQQSPNHMRSETLSKPANFQEQQA